MQDDDRFICAKDVGRSPLRQGFMLPVGMLFGFKSWFGELMPGASRDVTVRLNGASFPVRLGDRDFDEHLVESANWTDAEAGIVFRPSVIKVRRFDRAIGNNLKLMYEHRCQICGQQVAAECSVSVDEVHHIDPFVTSFNNDVSNLLVLCPNHHSVIHATAHPDFHRQTLSFVYPNDLDEKPKLNLHLT